MVDLSFIRLSSGDVFHVARSLREESWEEIDRVRASVIEIIEMVRRDGDKALIELTRKFDGVEIKGPLFLDRDFLEAASKRVRRSLIDALKRMRDRVFKYHEREKESGWIDGVMNSSMYGLLKIPLDRVGVYVPGGKALYPSTCIMTAVPARVAGVKEVYGFTPPSKNGFPPDEVLSSFWVAGVDGVYRVGGAQAIAAASLGTQSVKKVDKIVGPGNIYVSVAKKELFGTVGIDSIAGPSEVLIISDESQDPEVVSLDLLSQLEHDQMAKAVFLSTSEELSSEVLRLVEEKAKASQRWAVLKDSLKNLKVYVVDSLDSAVEFSNVYCPEHLQILLVNPLEILPMVRCAGSVFLGSSTPVALGDYGVGPNHVLPTGGSGRFSSPLGVHDFYRRIGVLYVSPEDLNTVADDVILVSKCEGFSIHGDSVEIRRRFHEKRGKVQKN